MRPRTHDISGKIR